MFKQITWNRTTLVLGTAAALVAVATPVSGQDVDPRLLPWIGCWAPSEQAESNELVCVKPAGQHQAVELLRISDGAVTGREVLWSDGRRHDTSRESCTGWEQGTFSEDGRRLFLEGSFTCDGVTQELGGVIAMATPVSWIDVRTAGMEGEHVAWVQRYRTASREEATRAGFADLGEGQGWSTATARMVASAALDIDDVIEASTMVPQEAVRALLAEAGDPFDLTADELIRMADAGVPDDVIDVAVAVSFPDRFQLDTGAGSDQVQVSALDTGSLRRRWVDGPYAGPAYYDPFYMPWSLRYGRSWYGYGYGYSPYSYGYLGYGGYGGFGYYGGYRPTVVVVDQAERSHGRVINGRGYSRGRTSSGGSGGSYVPRSRGSSGSTSGAATRSTGSSSRGSSTGRTAKRRGGGDF